MTDRYGMIPDWTEPYLPRPNEKEGDEVKKQCEKGIHENWYTTNSGGTACEDCGLVSDD